jgi:16S rRNA (guanine527-N7)-methyltransferase
MIVSRETGSALERYVELLLAENERQNLISRTSAEAIWSRHIEDSLQLLDHAPADARWLDIGSGPGLPGIVLAIAGVRAITLVEPRRLRTEFLEQCVTELALTGVTVITGKAERLTGQFDVVTARAVASLNRLFDIGAPLLAPTGRWVLPKGQSAEKELVEARATWQGTFRLEPSRTDPDARILVAHGVRRRIGRG